MSRIARRTLLGCLIMLLLVAGYVWWGQRSVSLEGWAKRVQRPGYTLLHQSETEEWYFAIFDAGGSQIAICHRCKGKEPSGMGFSIRDKDGKDLDDRHAPNRFNELDRTTNYVLFTYSDRDGLMYPIRKDYRGKIVVQVTADNQTGNFRVLDQGLMILEIELDWQPKSVVSE